MSVTNVIVPSQEARPEVRIAWEKEISTILEGGADVKFVNNDGDEVNIMQIGFFPVSGAGGALKSRGLGMTDAQATIKTLVAGGYIEMRISYIYSSGTDTGLNIHVRLK
jgi:hypothetical protein